MQTRYKMQKVDCRLRKKRRLRRKIVFFFSHQYNNLHIVTQLLFHGHLPWKFRKHVFVFEMGQKHYIIMYKSGRLKSQHCCKFWSGYGCVFIWAHDVTMAKNRRRETHDACTQLYWRFYVLQSFALRGPLRDFPLQYMRGGSLKIVNLQSLPRLHYLQWHQDFNLLLLNI